MKIMLALLRWTTRLPDTTLRRWGDRLGVALFWLLPARRQVILTNLALCFPHLQTRERTAIAKEHFRLFGQSFLERAVLWWGAPERIRARARIEGLAHLDALKGKPVVLFASHFIGLDIAWTRLSMERDMTLVYAQTKSPTFNQALAEGRGRFGQSRLLTKQAGMARAIASMKEGFPLYYMPDMDFGRRRSIFVPFFGVSTASLPGLSRLARESDATIVPVTVLMENDGWVVRIHPAWENFPGADLDSDTRRMNAFLEDVIAQAPAQYWWAHKRFKTRPIGEPPVY